MLDACFFVDIRNKEFSEISYELETDVADIQSFKIVIFFIHSPLILKHMRDNIVNNELKKF